MAAREIAMGQTALESLATLRSRLSEESPEFAAAAQVESGAEALCQQIRLQLKSHRVALGLQQSELAERIEFSQSAISKIESGHGDIPLKTLYRVADALGLRPVVMFVPTAETIAVGGSETLAHPVEDQAVLSHETAQLLEALQEQLMRQIPNLVQGVAASLSESG
jgi:transcriptional regulator with XRE-family HTH domain